MEKEASNAESNTTTENGETVNNTTEEGNVVYKFNIGDKEIQFVNEEKSTPSFYIDTVNIFGVNLEANIFGVRVAITETIFNTWILMFLLIIFALIVRLKVSKFKQIPTGFQNFVELLVDTFNSFTKMFMGEQNKRFAGFYMALFIFIFTSNILGLFSLRSPTSDLATTFAMSFTTVFMMHALAIYAKGFGGYVMEFFKPTPVMLPINILEKITPGLSLAIRLFGNILAGTIILGLFYALPMGWVKPFIPIPLHMYFDLFDGLIQAIIFTSLSMIFVARSIESETESSEHGGEPLSKRIEE